MCEGLYMKKILVLLFAGLFSFGVAAEDVLINKVRSMEGMSVKHIGPNCFNSALHINGLNKYIRFTEDAEFTAIVNSGFCRRLVDGEARKFGDIMAIRMPFNDGSYMEKHAQIVVDAERSFSKNNSQMVSKYETQDNAYLYEITGVEADSCKGNNGTKNISCEAATDIYRCDFSYEKLNVIQQEKMRLVEEIEKVVALRVSRDIVLTDKMFDDIEAVMEIEYLSLPKDEFIDSLVSKKLSSFSVQMELLSFGTDTDRIVAEKISSLLKAYSNSF